MELDDRGIGPDQRRYARLLSLITHLSFGLLAVLFLLYMAGIIEPHVAHDRLPELWKLPANEFLSRTGIGPGWGWAAWLHRGDVLTLVGIAALAFASVPCLLGILPFYWADRHYPLLGICVLEVVVIVLAASGIIAGGH